MPLLLLWLLLFLILLALFLEFGRTSGVFSGSLPLALLGDGGAAGSGVSSGTGGAASRAEGEDYCATKEEDPPAVP